jgi:diphthine synthase
VGLGPRGPAGLPPAALEAVQSAGAVFADNYTARLPEAAIPFLERLRHGPIVRLGRERLEAGHELLEAAAAAGGAVLLVCGDPMAATTHVALRVEAVRRGLPVRMVFAPSVVHMAFSEAGLQHYKAGRTVSLPFPAKGFAPTSPFEYAAANRAAGLHTLVLLDLHVESGRFMTANEGLAHLQAWAAAQGGAPWGDPPLAVAVARAGEDTCVRAAGALDRLAAMDFGPPMHCLILPGRLHDEERAALQVLCGARADELPPA